MTSEDSTGDFYFLVERYIAKNSNSKDNLCEEMIQLLELCTLPSDLVSITTFAYTMHHCVVHATPTRSVVEKMAEENPRPFSGKVRNFYESLSACIKSSAKKKSAKGVPKIMIVVTGEVDEHDTGNLFDARSAVNRPEMENFHLFFVGLQLSEKSKAKAKLICKPKHARYIDAPEVNTLRSAFNTLRYAIAKLHAPKDVDDEE